MAVMSILSERPCRRQSAWPQGGLRDKIQHIERREEAMGKTNALRRLDGLGIPYRVAEYEVDEEDLSGLAVARKIGLPPDQVFKTLVLVGDRTGPVVACLPVSCELDTKALAAVSGNRAVDLLPVRDLLPVTGYLRGGCSPIGMKKPYPSFLEEEAVLFGEISVSAGVRGRQILLAPEDLLRAMDGRLAALVRPAAADRRPEGRP